MKAKIKLSEQSNEELLKNKKALSTVTGVLVGMLIVLLIITIYSSITKGVFSPLIAVPFALSPMVIMNYQKIKEIRKELRSR